MSNEIEIVNIDGLRVDTRTLAPKLDIRHRNLIQNIRSYESEFAELGSVPFQTEARLDGQHGGGDVLARILNVANSGRSDLCTVMLCSIKDKAP